MANTTFQYREVTAEVTEQGLRRANKWSNSTKFLVRGGVFAAVYQQEFEDAAVEHANAREAKFSVHPVNVVRVQEDGRPVFVPVGGITLTYGSLKNLLAAGWRGFDFL